MSAEQSESRNPSATDALTRRRVFAGAGAVGALAAVAAVVPLTAKPTAPTPGRKLVSDGSANAGGYQLSDHVLRYYETARV